MNDKTRDFLGQHKLCFYLLLATVNLNVCSG